VSNEEEVTYMQYSHKKKIGQLFFKKTFLKLYQ